MRSCFPQTPCFLVLGSQFKCRFSKRPVQELWVSISINPSPYVLKHCYLDIVHIPFSATHHYTNLLQYKEKYKGKYISSSEHSNLSFPGQIIQSRQAFSVLFTFNFLLWICSVLLFQVCEYATICSDTAHTVSENLLAFLFQSWTLSGGRRIEFPRRVEFRLATPKHLM